MNHGRFLKFTGMFLLVSIGTMGFLIPFPADSSTEPESAVEVKKLSDRVIILTIPGAQATNVIALKGRDGLVVIDSEVSPTFAAAIRRRIVQEFGREDFAYLINTHDHGDHTYGNQVFSKAVIVGHENVPTEMKKAAENPAKTAAQLQAAVTAMQGMYAKMDQNSDDAKKLAARLFYYDQMRQGLAEGFQLTPPQKTFQDRMSLDLGDFTLQLTYFGYSHSKSDILIYCPEEQLLATGDLFYPGEDLYIDSERLADLPRWIKNLKELTGEKQEIRAIIPGHKDLIPMTELEARLDTLKQRQKEFAGRKSAFFAFQKEVEKDGLGKGLASLRKMKSQPKKFFVLHPEFDTYAYKMMLDGRLDESLNMFQVLTELFPDSYIAYDSLGEAYLRKENQELALANFRKSLELNPDNENAQEKIEEIQNRK